ncbi:MAG: damage-inducible protein DinB, partial [Gammaproteobacteria bacterium]|nr:damage-inducible protein DinB [Gammaproteobacteria bacterium]
MSLKRHFELMADYNRWMNGNLYQVAAELPAQVLKENRGAYFGSILGTLNHIMVGYIM